MTTFHPYVVRLAVGVDKVDESILAMTFGELVKLTLPTLQRYHSDLFHDATWLRENVTLDGSEPGSFVFEYVVRESGTHIGQHLSYISGDYVKYRVTLSVDERFRWDLAVAAVNG